MMNEEEKMAFVPLVEDAKSQSYLKDETKFLVEETLTTIMEIIMGREIKEWTDKEFEELEKYRRFQGKSFYYIRAKDGRAVVEYSDAVCLLIDYFASKPFGADYKNRIIKEQKAHGNEEFVEKKFRQEYDTQCDKERSILKLLGNFRNEEYGHAVERANMGDIYMWIHQIMKFIECFSGYRMQSLAEYDSHYRAINAQKRLDDCYTKASNLKGQCFSSSENCTIYKFGKNKYIVSQYDKDDFALLISDMARGWDNGIDYLKNDNSNNPFHPMLEESIEDYDIVMNFDKKFNNFKKTKVGSIEESILYLSMLYTVYPYFSGIYWKGILYSESHFASKVLQIITRHPKKFSFEDKVNTLTYRIDHFSEWNETNENQPGIEIDLKLMCREHILSMYYKGKNDEEGVSLAKAFESIILECADQNYISEHYDEIVMTTHNLTAYMRGRVTYQLPIPREELPIPEEASNGNNKYRIFQSPDDFRSYFLTVLEKTNDIDTIARFVYNIKDDNNLRYFFDNYQLYLEKENNQDGNN